MRSRHSNRRVQQTMRRHSNRTIKQAMHRHSRRTSQQAMRSRHSSRPSQQAMRRHSRRTSHQDMRRHSSRPKRQDMRRHLQRSLQTGRASYMSPNRCRSWLARRCESAQHAPQKLLSQTLQLLQILQLLQQLLSHILQLGARKSGARSSKQGRAETPQEAWTPTTCTAPESAAGARLNLEVDFMVISHLLLATMGLYIPGQCLQQNNSL